MAAAATILWLVASAALAASPERVRFESLARDTDRAVDIDALLFRPPGDPAIARPAIIALHGCNGMYGSGRGRDRLNARHAEAARVFTAAGYLVLFPDSLRSRGLEEVCTI